MTKYIQIAALLLAFGGGVLFDAKVLKQDIKVSCPECPDLSCPKQEPCNAVDWEELKKIKGKNINLTVHQHLTTQVNGDSTLLSEIERMVQKATASEVKKAIKENIKDKFLQ